MYIIILWIAGTCFSMKFQHVQLKGRTFSLDSTVKIASKFLSLRDNFLFRQIALAAKTCFIVYRSTLPRFSTLLSHVTSVIKILERRKLLKLNSAPSNVYIAIQLLPRVQGNHIKPNKTLGKQFPSRLNKTRPLCERNTRKISSNYFSCDIYFEQV